MAKPTGLIAKAQSLKILRGSHGDWRAFMTPKQRKDYDAFLDYLRAGTLGHDRPNRKQCRALVEKEFGRSITEHTFRKHLANEQ